MEAVDSNDDLEYKTISLVNVVDAKYYLAFIVAIVE